MNPVYYRPYPHGCMNPFVPSVSHYWWSLDPILILTPWGDSFWSGSVTSWHDHVQIWPSPKIGPNLGDSSTHIQTRSGTRLVTHDWCGGLTKKRINELMVFGKKEEEMDRKIKKIIQSCLKNLVTNCQSAKIKRNTDSYWSRKQCPVCNKIFKLRHHLKVGKVFISHHQGATPLKNKVGIISCVAWSK